MRKIGDGIREDWPPEIARLADISMSDYLRQRGASAEPNRSRYRHLAQQPSHANRHFGGHAHMQHRFGLHNAIDVH